MGSPTVLAVESVLHKKETKHNLISSFENCRTKISTTGIGNDAVAAFSLSHPIVPNEPSRKASFPLPMKQPHRQPAHGMQGPSAPKTPAHNVARH